MNLSRSPLLSTLAALGIAALTPTSAQAQYVFTKIAETASSAPGTGGGTFSNLGNPSLRGSNVAFRGNYTGGTGTHGIFANTGAGGALTTIATAGTGGSTTPAGGTFSAFGTAPSLSGSNIAFYGQYTGGTGTTGIFANTGAGGALTTIATGGTGGSATPAGGTFSDFGAPILSGSTVAFRGIYTGGTGTVGIFANTGAGGTLTTIATAGTGGVGGSATPAGGTFSGLGVPSLSDSTVAFSGNYTGGTGNRGIFANTGAGGALTAIATNATGTVPGGGNFSIFGGTTISGSNVAFSGSYTGGTGAQGIFANTGAGGALTAIATAGTGGVGGSATPAGGNFSAFGNPSLSGSNIAFQASYTGGAGTDGIFLSSGGSLTSVITTATPSPFGSSFTGFSFGSQGLDDTSIAFSYNLADGRSGIALATLAASGAAPEPGTLAFLALGGTLVLARRRRK